MSFSTNAPTGQLTSAQLMSTLRDNQTAIKMMQARVAEIKSELLKRIVATGGNELSTEAGVATLVTPKPSPRWDKKILDALLAEHPAIDEARSMHISKGYVRFKAAKKTKGGGA